MDDKFYNLIALVKQYPCLYDKNHASFRDVNKRNNAWKDVAKLCKMTVADCRHRWKLFRDKYSKAKRRILQKGPKSLPISSKTAEFMEKMNFLESNISHKPTKKKTVKEEQTEVVESSNNVSSSNEQPAADIVSIQLLPTLPITQWPQMENENEHYIKIASDATAYVQTQWGENSVDYKISIPDDDEPTESGTEKMSIGVIEYPQPSGISLDKKEDISEKKIKVYNSYENHDFEDDNNNISCKSVYDNFKSEDRVDDLVVKTLWNIVKDKTLHDKDDSHKEDQLFALSIIENLSKFPPKKKNLIKGEILLLMSRFDYKEIN